MTDKPMSLLDQLEWRYQRLLARDSTIRKYQNEMNRHMDKMRKYYQLRKVAKFAMRKQEEWLREEAAAEVRKQHGIQTIPGFNSRRQSAIAFRMALSVKHKEAAATAKRIIDGEKPPAPPPPAPVPPPS